MEHKIIYFDFHGKKSMGTSNCLVPKILQKIQFYVPHKKRNSYRFGMSSACWIGVSQCKGIKAKLMKASKVVMMAQSEGWF